MMDWFKLCLSWIIISAVYVSCQELSSTLREGNHACPGEEVNFTCTIRGLPSLTDLVLAWSSSEYIGPSNFLRFTTDNTPGTNVTSLINGNVVATLTSKTTVDGVPVLESQLRIVAVQASTVRCNSVTNGSSASKEFFISAVPGRPKNVEAAETSESTENTCIILVTWDPPANSSGSDIERYIVSVPSRNITEDREQTTIDALYVRDCRDSISVHVAAVNRLGCEGQPSADILASLLDNRPPSPNGPTTPNRPTTNGPTPVEGGSTISTSGIAAILAVICILLCTILITCVVAAVFFYKRTWKGQYAYRELQEVKQEGLQAFVIQAELKDLYKALEAQSDKNIQAHARSLSKKLKEKSSNEAIKGALTTALKQLQLEHGINVQIALHIMKRMVGDMKEIDNEFEKSINDLHTAAEKNQHAETLDGLIKQVDGREVQPHKIIGILQILCKKLQNPPQESKKAEKLYCFSGQWKGYYRQRGSKQEMLCTLIIDKNDSIAGCGNDISDYIISGKIEPNGKFGFTKQYKESTCNYSVIFDGSIEWTDQPILRGKCDFAGEFVLTVGNVGLEASVISLCHSSAKEVLDMDDKQKRKKITDVLSKTVSKDKLVCLNDEQLIKAAQAQSKPLGDDREGGSGASVYETVFDEPY